MQNVTSSLCQTKLSSVWSAHGTGSNIFSSHAREYSYPRLQEKTDKRIKNSYKFCSHITIYLLQLFSFSRCSFDKSYLVIAHSEINNADVFMHLLLSL
jgi:hypothetical protein